MLGVPAASSAPLKVLDSIVLASLVTSGGESLVTSGFFKIKSRLNSPAKVLEPKCHSCDIAAMLAGYGLVTLCVVHAILRQATEQRSPLGK